MNDNLKKREWVYTQPPLTYELCCNKNEEHEIEWSEYQGHIWCPLCEEDQYSSQEGIFSGPIPLGACEILGIRFDRFWLESEKVEIFDYDHMDEKDMSRFMSVEEYKKYLRERKIFLENSMSKKS